MAVTQVSHIKTGNPPTCSKQEHTMLSGSDIWCRFELNQYFSFLDKKEQKVPFRSRQVNTFASSENSKDMYEKLAGLTVGTTPAMVARKSQMTPLKKEHGSDHSERGSTLSHLVPQKTSRS
jgi:hypothetical protein